MADDDSSLRDAIAESEQRQRRGKRARMVRWTDLDRELAQRALAQVVEKRSDE